MKESGKQYTNISRIDVYKIDCKEANAIQSANHYLHAKTQCKYAFGVYYDKSIVGVLLYGHPVGFRVTNSITKNLPIGECVELKRVWIADGLGTNIESYTISRSLRLLKEYGVEIVVSYADPEYGHLGKIYQATNFIYQKTERATDMITFFIINGERLHRKVVGDRYGTTRDADLRKIDPNYKQIDIPRKHRYLYILADKKRKKRILKDLKYPSLPYPKENWDEEFFKEIKSMEKPKGIDIFFGE